MRKLIVWIIVLLVVIAGGYYYYNNRITPYKSFKIWVTDSLEKDWKYYLVEAIDVYLRENSNRYATSVYDILKAESPDQITPYKKILATREAFVASSSSTNLKALIKKNSDIQRELKRKDDIERNALLAGLSNKDLGITEADEKDIEANKEECYKLLLRMLEQEKYDSVTYEVDNVTGQERIIRDLAEMTIYLKELPTLSVAFYRSADGTGWVPFQYKIDCGSYLWRKEYLK